MEQSRKNPKPAGGARIVLGLDPGSRRTGYGVLVSGVDGIRRIASGVIHLDTERPFAERLPCLYGELSTVIREYQPHQAVLETCFVARSPRSALVLGHVRGVLLLLCLEAGLEVFEYTPAEVKRAITGNGGASKPQVSSMLSRLLIEAPRKPKQDEADALAIAYCHMCHPQVGRRRALLRV